VSPRSRLSSTPRALARLLVATALLGSTACGAAAAPPSLATPADDPSSSPTAATPSEAFTGTLSPTPTSSASPTPVPSPSPTGRAAVPTCNDLAASLTLSQQIGQLMMVGISSTGLSTSQARILSRGHVGSVILLGNTTVGRRPVKALAGRVHGLAGRPKGVAIMLAVDQEGGQVQRLRGPGFDRMPSARSQTRLSQRTLEARASGWGRQLRAAGVDANLAPVADLVPRSMERINRPVGVLQRGYGPDPDVVAAKVAAFVRGMQKAGVVTAVKHYPGLGRVRGNTDFETHVVDRITTRRDRTLLGFRAGAASGADMVMVSSAYYTRIDPKHRAVFSKTIIGQLLRKDARFTGVVISDDLAAQAVRDYSVGRRAVTFLAAGGDLLIVGDPRLAPTMVAAVKARASSDRTFRAELERKTVRVLTMKARRGLARCG